MYSIEVLPIWKRGTENVYGIVNTQKALLIHSSQNRSVTQVLSAFFLHHSNTSVLFTALSSVPTTEPDTWGVY